MDGSISAKGVITGEINASENHATLHGKIGTNSVQLRGRSYLPSYIAGTYDYEKLDNHPFIEGHELVGNSNLPQIGVNTATVPEIEAILYLD